MMVKFCTNCGASLNADVRFCQDCGAKTAIQPVVAGDADLSVQQPATVQPPTVVQEQTPPPQPAPVQQPPQHYIQQPPAPTVTPSISNTTPASALFYLGNIFLMGLPFAGLVLSILWGLNKTPSDKRSLARVMILFSIISIIVCVAMAIMLFIYTQVVAELHFKIFGIQIF
jgi:hypothetical protein